MTDAQTVALVAAVLGSIAGTVAFFYEHRDAGEPFSLAKALPSLLAGLFGAGGIAAIVPVPVEGSSVVGLAVTAFLAGGAAAYTGKLGRQAAK